MGLLVSRLLLGYICLLRIGTGLGVSEVVPIDQTQNYHTDNPSCNDGLEVLHPEFVLEFSRAFLELTGSVLKSVSLFVEFVEFLVSLENLLYVVPHDADDFVYLCLLLRHPLLRHDLLHLRRPRQGLAVRAEGPSVGTKSRFCGLTSFNIGHGWSVESEGSLLGPDGSLGELF